MTPALPEADPGPGVLLLIHRNHHGVHQDAFAGREFFEIRHLAGLVGRPVFGLEVPQGAVVAVPLHQAVDAFLDGPLGRLVQAQVSRGVNLQAQGHHLFFAEALLQLAPHVLGKVAAFLEPVRPQRLELDGLAQGRDRFRLGDVAHVHHAPEHIFLALLGPLGGQVGGVTAGRLGDARQNRRLRQGEVFHVLREKFLGRGLHPVGPPPQENVVQVDGEDFFLGEVLVDAVGQHRLFDLAAEAALRGEHDALHHLLGDGAPPWTISPASTFRMKALKMPYRSTPGCSKKRVSSAATKAITRCLGRRLYGTSMRRSL